MKIKLPYAICFGLCFAFLLTQCTLDEGTLGGSSPALALQIQPQLSLINLSWQSVKVTGFKEYVLLQSTGDIPNAPTPTVNQDITVLARINDADVTTFSTTTSILSPTSCFKLYCSVDDRFLYSNTVCINQPFTAMLGFFDRVAHDDSLDQIAMFDRLNGQLVSLNASDGTVTDNISETSLSFPLLDLTTYQGTNRLYAFDQSFNVIRKYSFPQLGFLNQRQFSESIVGGAARGAFVYFMISNATSGFLILNANTLASIDSKPGITGTRNLAFFSGEPLTVLEIGDVATVKYQVNAVGKVTSSDQFLVGVSQLGGQNTSDYNESYFIGGRFATILNKEVEIVTSLVVGVNSFTQLCRFSPDGTRAYVVVNNNNVVDLEIYDITNLPGAIKLKSYTLPAATFSDLYIKNNVINVIGISFNSSTPQTFFLKFPI